MTSILASGAWTDGQAGASVHGPVADTVRDRLPGEAELKVAAMAGQHAETADHVVDRLGPGSEHDRVDGREVVLAVDPLCDDERRREDGLERFSFRIYLCFVGVEEEAAAEVDSPGHRTGSDDEGGVAGETPLREHLSPVRRPFVGHAGRRALDLPGWRPGQRPAFGAEVVARLSRSASSRRRSSSWLEGTRWGSSRVTRSVVVSCSAATNQVSAGIRCPGSQFAAERRPFRMAAAVRALGAPRLPPQAPQSRADSYGLFSVVLP